MAGDRINGGGSRITVKDIAREVGVTHTTVSRALLDRPGISARTKTEVRRAAERLGYVANTSARDMRSRASDVVGLVVPNLRVDFFTSAAGMLAQACRSRGFRLLLSITEDDGKVELEQIRALAEARSAGILWSPSPVPAKATLAMVRRMPFVQFLREYESAGGDSVGIDNAAGTRLAVDHLVKAGHRAIGFIGARLDVSIHKRRLDGVVEGHAAAGISLDERFVKIGTASPEFGRSAFGELWRSDIRPTALILGSSEISLGVLEAVRVENVCVPEVVSLIGFGDPRWSQLLGSALTAISVPTDEIAAAATACLLRRLTVSGDIEGAQSGIPSRMMFAPHLISRQSVGPPRA